VGREWLERNWMYAGAVCGVLLIALGPVLAAPLGPALLAVYAQLPAYMIHQVEEHHRDRFRLWFNATIGGGREALTPFAVLVINLAGVWAVDVAALYLARFVAPGLGLIAVYLTLVNAVVHVAGGVVQRRYNPGLVTAVVLFLPCAAWGLVALSGASAAEHVIGLACAVLVHLAIVAHVRRRLAL